MIDGTIDALPSIFLHFHSFQHSILQYTGRLILNKLFFASHECLLIVEIVIILDQGILNSDIYKFGVKSSSKTVEKT